MWRIIGFASNRFLLRIRRISVYHVLMMVMVFLTILAANLYLVVFVNDGFASAPRSQLYYVTALPETRITVTIFWLVIITLLTGLGARISRYGWRRFGYDLVQAPAWLYACIEVTGKGWVFPFLLGAGVALALSLPIQNPFTLLAIAAMALLSFTAQLRSGLLYFTVLAAAEIYRKRQEQRLNLGALSLAIFGLFIGLLISYFLPFKPYSALILMVFFFAIAVLVRTGRLGSNAAASILIVLACRLFLFRTMNTLAHDGGWREGGGNLADWGQSPGAAEATAQGIVPSFLGSLWSLFSSIGSGVAQNLLPGPSPTVAGPGVLDIAGYGAEIMNAGSPEAANRAAASGIYDRLLPGFGGVMNPMVESVLNFGRGGGEGSGSDRGGGGQSSGGGSRGRGSTRRDAGGEPREDDPRRRDTR
ncbi:MAG: hypothetical protein R6V13_08540 [Anaerolineae bacterium]